MMKKVRAKRFTGPFAKPPFDNFIQSPIGLVPKSNGDTRLIFHLSYPRMDSSINSETLQELCMVKYKDIQHAIKLCLKAGKGCFTGKANMKSTFRNLPIHPDDWPLLIMAVDHPVMGIKYHFIYKCLPFGTSISCSHFQ